MSIIDYVLLIHAGIFLIHSAIFLLYQFEVLDIDEDFMITTVRILNVIETIILVVTRFVAFGPWGTFVLAAFYILNIMLLVLQFVFADFGVGHKFLDCLWIVFYIFMFTIDVLGVSIVDIDSFLHNSFLGDIIIGFAVPAVKGVITDVLRRKE